MTPVPVIQCTGLRHSYGDKPVLHGIDFTVDGGGIFGLLGKNGAGKSTTINILMGFLRPSAGECRIFGHSSHALPPTIRRDIGLLHEGFVQYDFMNISEIERFHAAFYPRWDRSVYDDLVDMLDVPRSRRMSRLSCGQRSQVVLGLILAQNPRLMILDDYSMGLDVGYRRLFLEYLQHYVQARGTTVLLTSHVVQELDRFIDHMVILQKGRVIASCAKRDFSSSFRHYRLPRTAMTETVTASGPLVNVERNPQSVSLFSYAPAEAVAAYLATTGIAQDGLEEVGMSFEDAFIGLTGRY